MKYQITQEVCLADDDDDFDTCDEWSCDNLRDALNNLFATRTARVDSGPEPTRATFYRNRNRLTLTKENGREFFTGVIERRTLSVQGISRPSAYRIIRLLNIKLDN